jgi:hypothetical protein
MRARRFARHFAGYTGAVALIAIGGLTAGCGNNATNNPTTATTTTTTTTTIATTTSAAAAAPPPAAPTQKNLSPTGPNSFAPNPNTPPPAFMPPSIKQNPYLRPGARPPG